MKFLWLLAPFPPMTVVDTLPQVPVVIPAVSEDPGMAIDVKTGPVVSFAVPMDVTSLPPEAPPATIAPTDMLAGPLIDGFQGFPHPLDRGLSRTLDYQGFRFRSIDHLYLGFMITEIGFPEKIKSDC